MANVEDLTKLKIGKQSDWKFGLVTRTVTRVGIDKYEIDDISGVWVTATVDLETLKKLISGEKDLLSLNWV